MGGPLINEKGSVYGKLTVIEAVRRPEDRKLCGAASANVEMKLYVAALI